MSPTPGRWRAIVSQSGGIVSGTFFVESSDGVVICAGPDPARGPESAADARLIAAAPDLLAAAKRALNDRMYKEWPEVADLLLAAIAKAEGA